MTVIKIVNQKCGKLWNTIREIIENKRVVSNLKPLAEVMTAKKKEIMTGC